VNGPDDVRQKVPAAAEAAATPTVNAAVTRLLDRKETRANPKAIAAVRTEGRALADAGTWLESTVTEKTNLVNWAQTSGTHINMGELMSICSVKFSERAIEHHIYKGRICYRGDCARDEYGALAVYQEMAANPTTIHTANSNLAYGCMPGHKTTQADAIRAYIQALLNTACATWVAIPFDLWPEAWKGKFKKPMCKLIRALYGHPESGAHWEVHLTQCIVGLGGVAVEGHPSSFWFAASRLLLTVYVDDLLLSGPEALHEEFWGQLGKQIDIDPPAPLSRFLGRAHVEV